MNLYDILGVARDATRDVIRATFRSRAKAAHPDRGGLRQQWEQLKLAHDTLIDAERRDHYDQTGEIITERPEDKMRTLALVVLSQLINRLISLEEDIDLTKHDLRDTGIKELTRHIQLFEAQLVALEKARQKALALTGRWKSSGEDNILESVVQSQFDQLAQNKANTLGQIEVYKIAIAILQDHKFNFDKAVNSMNFQTQYYGQNYASSGTTNTP